VTGRAATAIYAAIVSDTGSFQYESTTPHTFEVAAALVRAGVRPEEVARRLFDNAPLGRLRLMEQVLATLETFGDGRIACIRMTRRMLETTGTGAEDAEYLVNLPRMVGTVAVAVFFKEMEQDVVSVSLRAKGDCDVAAVAAGFGGGGHRNAAGFRMRGVTVDQVRDRLVPVLLEALEG